MEAKRKIYLLIFSLFLISFVSANGLMVSPETITLQKVVGNISFEEINITNTESFVFYNISVEDNSYLSMDPIAQLDPGQSVSAEIKIFSNANVNRSFKIKGFYQSQIGASNQTYTVAMDRNDGANPCVLSIVKGDKVKFQNLETSSIRSIIIHREDTGAEITVAPNSSTIMEFDVPTEFDYKLYDISYTQLPYSSPCECKIVVLDDQGLINNPLYDTEINFDITNIFNPTEISASTLKTNYSLDFFSQDDGIITITNNGSYIAKNIHLDNDWFVFTINDFDLSSGYTKNIPFTIKPKIFSTNETNKTYNKVVTITGNFDTTLLNYNIFIKHANINAENISASDSLFDFMEKFCSENPNICNTEPTIIYRDLNNSENFFNVSLGEKQLHNLFSMWMDFIDQQSLTDNYYKQQFSQLNNSVALAVNSSSSAEQATKEILKEYQNSNSIWIFFGMIICTIIISGLLVYLALHYKKKKNKEAINVF